MRKFWFVLLILPLLTSCYARSNGIPLFDSYGYRYTPKTLEVQKGDTLYKISRRYNVPLRGIIEENNLSAPYALNVGQILKLPVRQIHTVAKGETLYAIARKYNVDITTLSKINDLSSPYALNVGQELELPSSIVTRATSSIISKGENKFSTSSASKSIAQSKKVSTSSRRSYKSSQGTPVSSYRKTKFVWPVNGSIVSNFGFVGKGRKNDGINIKAALGTNVKAADKGVVAYAGNELKGFGNLVLIKHYDGYITAYAHADKIYVKKGQKVLRGEKIATVGKTGGVNVPQLHFEVRAGKKAVNPRKYLP